jgi:ubiquinone/menaquinone biosynthesis C-methylase UbiE
MVATTRREPALGSPLGERAGSQGLRGPPIATELGSEMAPDPSVPQHPSGWRSYDSVADAYADVVTLRNVVMTRDLVALVAPRFGGAVLDVGAGAGAAAQAAIAATGPTGLVVAVDPSFKLIRRVEPRQRIRVAVAVAAALPLASGAFDAVVANLVLNHVPDYRAALAEMVGVLRRGGRLGVTAWGVLGDAPPVDERDEQAAAQAWIETASEYGSREAIDAAAREALPWEGWFSDPAHLRAGLEEAGLHQVELTGRAYRSLTSHAEWLSSVNTGAKARYLRDVIDRTAWDSFCDTVLRRLRGTVPEPFERVAQMLFAVGTRPGRGRATPPTIETVGGHLSAG